MLEKWLNDRPYMKKCVLLKENPEFMEPKYFLEKLRDLFTIKEDSLELKIDFTKRKDLIKDKRKMNHKNIKYSCRVFSYLCKEEEIARELIFHEGKFVLKLLLQDFLCLSRMTLVQPQILRHISINSDVLDVIFNEYSKSGRFNRYQILSLMIIGLRHKSDTLYQSINKSSIFNEASFTFPITEDMQRSYDFLLEYVLCESKDKVYDLIHSLEQSNILPIVFCERAEEINRLIMKSFHANDNQIKCFYQLLMRYVFSKVNRVSKEMNKYSEFIPDLIYSKVSDLGLHPSLIDQELERMTIYEMIEAQPKLRKASDELHFVMFEWSPYDILYRVDNCLSLIRGFFSDRLKEKNQNSAFIAFDDTFLIFTATLSCSGVKNFKAIVSLACDYSREKLLTNEFAFAQMILKASLEYDIRTQTNNSK